MTNMLPGHRNYRTAEAADPTRHGSQRWRLAFWQASGGVYWWLTGRAATGAAHLITEHRPIWGVIAPSKLTEPMQRLREALPDPFPAELPQDAVRRALGGCLTSPERERELSTDLAALLLPVPLRKALTAAATGLHTVVIATCPQLAAVPWELLMIGDGDTRLIERAEIRAGLHTAGAPPTEHRAHRRNREEQDARAPFSLALIDPTYGTTAAIYPRSGADSTLWKRIGPTHTDEYGLPRRAGTTRTMLAAALARRPDRLFYFGHLVGGPADEPARAGLLLADGPLTAAEILTSPTTWPMPATVAFVGCQGDDASRAEPLGLVTAALSGGADLVTTTRWVLPQDSWVGGNATTELGIAVDTAHAGSDPVGALRSWQLRQLRKWRQYALLSTAPLVWAAPVSYRRTAPTAPPPETETTGRDRGQHDATAGRPAGATIAEQMAWISVAAAGGRLPDALRQLTQLFKQPEQTKSTTGQLHLIAAMLFFQSMRLDLAGQHIRQALTTLDHGSLGRCTALALAAELFAEQGCPAKADANLKEALYWCPERSDQALRAVKSGRQVEAQDQPSEALHALLQLAQGNLLRRDAEATLNPFGRNELCGTAEQTLLGAERSFIASALPVHGAYCRYLRGEVALLAGHPDTALQHVTAACDGLRSHPTVWVWPAVSKATLLLHQHRNSESLAAALPALLVLDAGRRQFADSPDRLRWAALIDKIWDVAFLAAAAADDGQMVAELIERARTIGGPWATGESAGAQPWSFAEMDAADDSASVPLTAPPRILMPWGIALSAAAADANLAGMDTDLHSAATIDILAELGPA